MSDKPAVKTGASTSEESKARIEEPSTKTGPLCPAEREDHADRIAELTDQRFASERRGDEVTDEEFAEALRWLIEGPRLSTEELLAFLERNKRLHAETDRAVAKIIAKARRLKE